MVYLLFLALAPAALLMFYVWKKDKSKEPFGMLLVLVILGVLSCIPASVLESLLQTPIASIFGGTGYLYHFVFAFFGVALVEEGCKFVFMYLYTHKHKEFNGLFDGMIYAVFVSLGFAGLENVLYVVDGGTSVALTRGLMAVPGHMFFAVFMGYYYSLWHVNKLCDESEKYFANLGFIQIKPPAYTYQKHLWKALVIPVLFHGLYDFCLFTENIYLVVFDLVLVGVLYIVCFKRIKSLSYNDIEDYRLIPYMLCQKYPELTQVVNPTVVNPLSVPQNYYEQRTYQQTAQQGKGVYYDPYVNRR